MGFLRKIILISFSIFLAGCAKSLIQVNNGIIEAVHPIFGKNSERNFYYDFTTSDSLKLVWTADTYGSFNNSSIVANDSIVFIADLAGRLHVFNLENGKQKGVLKTKGAIFSTPLLYKFRVYYPLVKEGKKLTELIVYDYYAGKDLYIIEIQDLITNQILNDEDGIYLFSADGTIYKYNYEARLQWSVETNKKISFVPALKNNRIFLGNESGEFIVLNTKTGNILYRKKIASHFFSGASIDNYLCYLGDNDGNLFGIDINSFQIIFITKTDGKILMNPAIDDSNIYFGNMKRMLYCIDKKNGKIIWEEKTKGYFNSTPIVTKNHLIISNTFKSIMIFNKYNGTLLNEIELDNRAKLSPVIIRNKLLIGFDEGIIAAYEFIN